MNSECSRSDLVVKGLEALVKDLKKYPPLGDRDPRIVAVFDVVLNGADAELDEEALEVLTRLGVPPELYVESGALSHAHRRHGACCTRGRAR